MLVVLAPLPLCVAVTFEAIYDDNARDGLKDETALRRIEKEFLSSRGNNAETVGDARKNAFERAISLLESSLINTNTIRISAKFLIPPGEEDPSNVGECRSNQTVFTVAYASPAGFSFPDERIVEGDINNPGSITLFPYALGEALLGVEFNAQRADISIRFSKCAPFYYGFTGSVPRNQIDFVQATQHEIMHGLGFLHRIQSDGTFPLVTLVDGDESYPVKTPWIYDEQLYSQTDDDLLVNLTSSQRAAAITSGTGLLWEGTDGGRNDCSYAKRVAELKPSSAKSSDGEPRLYAPSTYEPGGSIMHVHSNAEDLMEAFAPAPKNMDLTLGMLRDIGWSVSADGFPPGCEPTGITVTPTSGLVTTEAGGAAKFEVELDSEPMEDVRILVESSDTGEGVPDPQTLEITFTPSNWDTPQEVAVRGVDDGLPDGPQDYRIELEVDSDDRFYAILGSQFVDLRNEEDDLVPELSIEDADAEEAEGTMDFAVSLTYMSTDTVTAQYSITGVSAQEGVDYDAPPLNATVTFLPGELRNSISITLIDDDEQEEDETVAVSLSNPQNAVLAQNGDTATGTIRDNDQLLLLDDQLPPPPPPNTQAGSNQQPPSTDTTPSVERQPAENPQQPQQPQPTTPSPPSAGEAGGGGGCAIASGEGADHTASTLLNLLPAVFAAFSLLSLKNRP